MAYRKCWMVGVCAHHQSVTHGSPLCGIVAHITSRRGRVVGARNGTGWGGGNDCLPCHHLFGAGAVHLRDLLPFATKEEIGCWNTVVLRLRRVPRNTNAHLTSPGLPPPTHTPFHLYPSFSYLAPTSHLVQRHTLTLPPWILRQSPAPAHGWSRQSVQKGKRGSVSPEGSTRLHGEMQRF